MSGRYIDADALINRIVFHTNLSQTIKEVLEDEVNAEPTADVRENVRGEWIDTGSGQECSVCKEIQYGYDNYRNFCPNCGASMKGENDG